MEKGSNISFAKGGPRFPIANALRLIATTLQAHMPAVRPEMTIWGLKGGPPPFFWAKSYFLSYLERHAKIQN